ncbi:MAG TPA: nucleotide exchange factor GrpE [Actinomycetes bacterium]|nr:nucleotide exchange factor GrpE [Actinomycetes bacterium]
MTEFNDEREGPVIRDKRRIDPQTGEVREAAPASAGAAAESWAAEDAAAAQVEGDLAELEAQLAERTADVQRVHAEYANYRKRVDRDREQVRDMATAAVLAELLTVLDDIDRARDHGELEGGFKSVAEAIEATVTKLGLEKYGTEGEPFDPTIHEALTHAVDESVSETTCVSVFQPGYRFAGRVLRPARVAVADPPS